MAALAVGKRVAIGSAAYGLIRSGYDRPESGSPCTDAISECGWKSDHVERNHSDGHIAASKDDGTGRYVAFLFASWVARPFRPRPVEADWA